MKQGIVLILVILFFNMGFSKDTTFSPLKGAYLGQKPPGSESIIFAPGFVSTADNELNSVFSADGKEFYFSKREGRVYNIYHSKETGYGWSPPVHVAFNSEYSDVDMCITRDGGRMYFSSRRPLRPKDRPADDHRIWYVDRFGEAWSKAKFLNAPINLAARAIYPSVTDDGALYFQGITKDSHGGKDVYRSAFKNGHFMKPVNLGQPINSELDEGDCFIAPDERYIIVSTLRYGDCYGHSDLYISFKKVDGGWGKLFNMGEAVNSDAIEYSPMLSPDRKYLFFTSTRSGNGDIYWIDAAIIEKIKEH